MPLEITRRDGRREALAGLIDYAGLFPPASLGMEAAVAEYRQARTGPHAWILERFICPAGRLLELAGVLSATMTGDEEPWSLVVTARPTDAGLVTDFETEMSGGADVAVVETLFPEAGDADAVLDLLGAFGTVVFFEVPWQSDFVRSLDVLAAVRESSGRGLGAKVRCGGLTVEAFPSPEALGGFLVACRDRRIPVKATAGLHHPIRHVDPATGFTHHGFLNLLAATAFAHQGEPVPVLADVLAERDGGAFGLDVRGLRWRDRSVDGATLGAVRSGLFVGYGSCSFDEPVADLASLGMFPEAS
ncbi:MAG: hypothetical protein HZA58_03450 [Acidimicrobiia bacterium]|nr:hypothetical protein [Acidimicrobiia bacterium]